MLYKKYTFGDTDVYYVLTEGLGVGLLLYPRVVTQATSTRSRPIPWCRQLFAVRTISSTIRRA